MCGRYNLTANLIHVARRFGSDAGRLTLEAAYNILPTSPYNEG